VEQEEVTIAGEGRGKHVSATTNKHATIEEILEAVFSMRFKPRLYSEDRREMY
jgi:hypothetical protein